MNLPSRKITKRYMLRKLLLKRLHDFARRDYLRTFEETEEESRKSPSRWSIALGRLRRFRFIISERLAQQRYALREATIYRSLFRQTFAQSGAIVATLILLLFLTSVADHIFWISGISLGAFATSFASQTVFQILQAYSGAIAAVLGIIIALYAITFQLSTQDYSRDVSKYINSEMVGSSFFKILVFSLLYDLFGLIRVGFISTPPVITLLSATLLSAFALLAILIYRSHNLLSSRPEHTFGRIYTDFKKSLGTVSSTRSNWNKSQILSAYASDTAQTMVRLTHELHQDLLRKGDARTSLLGFDVVAGMLQDYMIAKPNLQKELTRWFPIEYKPINSTDFMQAVLARHYSLQGRGTPQLPTRNYEWLERRLLETLKYLTQEMLVFSQDHETTSLLSSLIMDYAELLAGDGQYNQEGKIHRGLFAIQAFDIFPGVLDQFFKLWEHIGRAENIDAEELASFYINALHRIGNAIIEGFDQEQVRKASQCLFERNGALISREKIRTFAFPTAIRAVLEDYWEKLDVELQVEGRCITPPNVVEQDIVNQLLANEEKNCLKYFQLILDESRKYIQSKEKTENVARSAEMFKCYLIWLKRILALSRNALLNLMIVAFSPTLFETLERADGKILRELELRDDLEDVVFFSLLYRIKDLYPHLVKMRLFVELLSDEPEQQGRGRLTRSTTAVGGYAFLISEIDQDAFWVTTFTDSIRPIFKPEYRSNQGIGSVLETSISYPMFVALPIHESQYYQNWFNSLKTELAKLEIEQNMDDDGHFPFMRYKHPSPFIGGIEPDSLLDLMDESIRGYIAWLGNKTPSTI